MRLRAILFAAIVFAGIGYGSLRVAELATGWLERSTTQQLAEGLAAAGQGWAKVGADGLGVTLSGAAPDETSRFRTLEVARRIVDERRITDATTLSVAALAAPPAFALELLRNDADVSLIGLVPEAGGRDVIRSALRAGGLDDRVADMLETAADPAPDGWRTALGFGLSLLAELPRAKVSIAPGTVSLISVADSEAQRDMLETRLAASAPPDVRLTLSISAPRPVIAPFLLDFRLASGTAVLDSCTADSEETAAAILAAAHAAGMAVADPACPVGVGAPSPEWRAAVVAGIGTVGALGGGRFAIRDLAAEISAPRGTAPERLAEAAAQLEAALPGVFTLSTVAPPPEPEDVRSPASAPRFEAVRLLDGSVRLTGPVQDETARAAIESVAAALFGHARVADETQLDNALPDGWTVRVLAGMEALSLIEEGRLEVEGETVRVSGWSLDAGAGDRVRSTLGTKLGPDVQVDVTYNADAAAQAALAARPRPEICADQIGAILESGAINFSAGSAEIVPESAGVIAAIADVLRGCPGAEFEIAGHTDGQGAAEVNLALSEARAAAVVAALDLPLVTLVPRGYGASRPIAPNDAPEGRAKNRRIEFVLGQPAPEDEAPSEAAGAPTAMAATLDCVAEVDAALAGSRLEFEPGSAALTEASGPVVEAIGEALSACPGAEMEVGGHTDSQGSESGNLALSERRAQAVVDALQANGGSLPRLAARGYGEAEPVADNADEAGRAQNRRIAFTLLSPDETQEVAGDGEAGESEAADDATGPESAAADVGSPHEASVAAHPAVDRCVAAVGTILGERSIEFAPGSATLAEGSQPVLAALREALAPCPDAALEVRGYTDSEGSDAGNLRLSQSRAEAVLAALRDGGPALAEAHARGFGESDPAADNATAEGRARNRRITVVAATQAPEASGEADGSE